MSCANFQLVAPGAVASLILPDVSCRNINVTGSMKYTSAGGAAAGSIVVGDDGVMTIDANDGAVVIEASGGIHIACDNYAESPTEAALVIDGGIGIGQNARVAGTVYARTVNTETIYCTDINPITPGGKVNIIQSGGLLVHSTADANSTTDASTVLYGGIGVGMSAIFGGEVHILSTEVPDGSPLTGALTVAGGAKLGGLLKSSAGCEFTSVKAINSDGYGLTIGAPDEHGSVSITNQGDGTESLSIDAKLLNVQANTTDVAIKSLHGNVTFDTPEGTTKFINSVTMDTDLALKNLVFPGSYTSVDYYSVRLTYVRSATHVYGAVFDYITYITYFKIGHLVTAKIDPWNYDSLHYSAMPSRIAMYSIPEGCRPDAYRTFLCPGYVGTLALGVALMEVTFKPDGVIDIAAYHDGNLRQGIPEDRVGPLQYTSTYMT